MSWVAGNEIWYFNAVIQKWENTPEHRRMSWIQKRTVIPWNGPRQWNLRSQPNCEPLDSEPCDICSGAEISEQQLKDSGTAVEERCGTAWRAWLRGTTQIHMSRFTLAYTFNSTIKSDHAWLPQSLHLLHKLHVASTIKQDQTGYCSVVQRVFLWYNNWFIQVKSWTLIPTFY